MKWISLLLLLCGTVLLASCTSPLPVTKYTFDFSTFDENQPQIIPHNSILALTFNEDNPVNIYLTETENDFRAVYQTKRGCWNGTEEFDSTWQEDLSTQLHLKDSVPASHITLSLPYRPLGGMIDKPGTVCVGTYSQDQGWKWDYTPILPLLDDAAQQGNVEIELDAKKVAAVAILFDATTSVGKIVVETST